MPLRPMKLPGDFVPLIDMVAETFQYPENPEWGIQADEHQDMTREMRVLKRLWPVFRVLQVLSPGLRDVFGGFVWEDAGKMVGVVLYERRGANSWHISTVGVLPEFRGRGIARQLVTQLVNELRKRGGIQATLGVIDRNVPAYSLYSSLGFERYNHTVELDLTADRAPAIPELPSGYVREDVRRSEGWRVQYELDKQISPSRLTQYEPVVPGQYRAPAVLRAFLPIRRLMQRREEKMILIRQEGSGNLVAWGAYNVPKRSGGVSTIQVRLDPQHPQLADCLVAHHLERVCARSPGRRVTANIPSWMPDVIHAAERYGFTRRVEVHYLGLMLQEGAYELRESGTRERVSTAVESA